MVVVDLKALARWLLWLTLVGANAAAQAREPELEALLSECQGCHGPARSQPPHRFAVGLGAWSDRQCFGCHAEIDEVAEEVRARQPSRRRLGLPVRTGRLEAMGSDPLPYLTAPESLMFVRDGTPRIALDRLAAFLRRPAQGGPAQAGHADAMMAFPGLDEHRAVELARALGADADPPRARTDPDRAGAEKLWRTVCRSCHGEQAQAAGRTAAYLALLTPEWIYRYATGAVHTDAPRTMPVFALDRAQAEGLHALFVEARQRLERELDRSIARRVATLARELEPGAIPDGAIDYLFGPFLRDAGCVHCHSGGEGRASGKFRASSEGLADYVERRGGLALFQRLEARALETDFGLGAAEPGMPMTQGPLPENLRRLVLRWALAGCPKPDGKRACEVLKITKTPHSM